MFAGVVNAVVVVVALVVVVVVVVVVVAVVVAVNGGFGVVELDLGTGGNVKSILGWLFWTTSFSGMSLMLSSTSPKLNAGTNRTPWTCSSRASFLTF